MLNKSGVPEEFRFIILIIGMDTEKLLNEYRSALFAEGFYGAYSFPPAAPLAELSRPFNRDELKELAGNIRDLTMPHDGKISCAENASNAGFGEYSFFGPRLNFIETEDLFPKTARGKIARSLFPPVLCAAMVHSVENPMPKEGPALSFRAAALANLAIRPLPAGTGGEVQAFSFEWKMGEPIWLPAYKKNKAEK
jgi:hypothetical protein